MNSVSLYVACVLIWGSTWLAITYQLGQVPPTVSVAYRFALAAAILLAYCGARALPLRYTLRDHAWMALQGLLLFGANYVLVYLSEAHISSGLTAVVFFLVGVWDCLGLGSFFPTPPRPPAAPGACLG